MLRKIKNIAKSVPTLEGAGVHLKRVFGSRETPAYDPFLLLDDFHSDNPDHYLMGFPWHPHRGIETITYVLRGRVEHGDSLGNKGTIGEGDVQWMTAGSGIVHQEMPEGDPSGRLHGFQLWANLPAAKKMMYPRYRDVKNSDIPTVSIENGISVRIICGEFGGVYGPVRDIVTDPEYLDVTIARKGVRMAHAVKRGYTAFAYVVAGAGVFDGGLPVGEEHVVLFGDGDEVSVEAGAGPLRFLLVSGRPLGEPVAWYGPIVMNTEEELRTAFEEYEAGTFLKH